MRSVAVGGTNLLSFHPSHPSMPIAPQTMMAPPRVSRVMAVPAALGMKKEQKRVRGIVRDNPIVATDSSAYHPCKIMILSAHQRALS